MTIMCSLDKIHTHILLSYNKLGNIHELYPIKIINKQKIKKKKEKGREREKR